MSVIQLPNGKWAYRFQVGVTQYRRPGLQTRHEAEEAEALKKADAIRFKALGPDADSNIRLKDVADRFFEEYSVPLTRTSGLHGTHIAVFKEFFGNRRIKDISPRDVVAFRRWIGQNGRGLRGPKRTPHTVNHYHATLKAIINWAKKQRLYYGDNPAWGVEMAKVEKAKVRFLYPAEEKRLTPVVAKSARLWPYYVLALHTGMRVGELAALTVKDFNVYPEPMLFVAHSKSRRSRYVPLYGEALEIVKVRIQGRGLEESLLGGWQKATVSEWLEDACKESQVLDGFTFHCLRHTFAAHMLSKGVPIYKVSKIMGHSTVLVTEQHYGHLDNRVLSDEIHHIDTIMSVPRAVEPSGIRGVVNKSSTERGQETE